MSQLPAEVLGNEEELDFYLQHAIVLLQLLRKSIESGEYSPVQDPNSFLVDLATVQNNLCLAWYARDGRHKQQGIEFQIPNWNLRFDLVEPTYSRRQGRHVTVEPHARIHLAQ